jgi:hypothetical protein
MSNTIGIRYEEAKTEISKIEKAIDDLYINVELIDDNTNGIANDTWVGKDADIYKEKILKYSNKLKNQTDSFKEVTKTLRNIIEDFKNQEESNDIFEYKNSGND